MDGVDYGLDVVARTYVYLDGASADLFCTTHDETTPSVRKPYG